MWVTCSAPNWTKNLVNVFAFVKCRFFYTIYTVNRTKTLLDSFSQDVKRVLLLLNIWRYHQKNLKSRMHVFTSLFIHEVKADEQICLFTCFMLQMLDFIVFVWADVPLVFLAGSSILGFRLLVSSPEVTLSDGRLDRHPSFDGVMLNSRSHLWDPGLCIYLCLGCWNLPQTLQASDNGTDKQAGDLSYVRKTRS